MPNKNYNRGRAFEYRVKAHLEKQGWTVFRMAGSHSVADLIAADDGAWYLVQCKTDGKLPAAERKKLIKVANKLGAWAKLAYRENRSIVLRSLY